MPGAVAYRPEVQPARLAAVAKLANQPMAVQVFFEQALENNERLVRGQLVESESGPGLRGAFHDESARRRVDSVRVRPYPAAARRHEQEIEIVKYLVRTEPDVLVPAGMLLGLEASGVSPCPAAHAVGREDQVGRGELRQPCYLMAVLDAHA